MNQAARNESRCSRQTVFFAVRQALGKHIDIVGAGRYGQRGGRKGKGVKGFVVQSIDWRFGIRFGFGFEFKITWVLLRAMSKQRYFFIPWQKSD